MKTCKRGHEHSMKSCPTCKSQWYQNNKEKEKLAYKRWIEADSKRAFLRQRKAVVSRFNLTLDDYDKMFKLQDGKCKICTISQDNLDKLFAIDHDHKTGKIRGLLCSTCNQALGLLKDNIDNFLRAAEYLGENLPDV